MLLPIRASPPISARHRQGERNAKNYFAGNGHRRNGCMEGAAAGATIAAAAFLALRSFTPLLTRKKGVPKFRTSRLRRARVIFRAHKQPDDRTECPDAHTSGLPRT